MPNRIWKGHQRELAGRVAAEEAVGLERGLDAVSTTNSITCPPVTLKESSSIMIGIILEYKLPCRIHSLRCGQYLDGRSIRLHLPFDDQVASSSAIAPMMTANTALQRDYL